jgi:hypothetical protein
MQSNHSKSIKNIPTYIIDPQVAKRLAGERESSAQSFFLVLTT